MTEVGAGALFRPVEALGRRVRASAPVFPAVVGAACISSSAILVRLADAGAATTTFFRCALALPFLFVVSMAERRKLGGRSLRDRLGPFVAGLFLGVDLVLWTHAIYDVGAGVATVLGNLQVIFVALAAWAVFGERPGRRLVGALPVVAIGVVLVAGLAGPTAHGYRPVAGVVYGVATSVTYAAFLLVLRRSASSSSHVAGPLIDATWGGAVAALVLGACFGGLQLAPPLPVVGWLLVLAVTSQTVGWLLITSSLPRLPAALSSVLLLLQPAASLFLAAIVLSQRPTVLQVVGAVVVCAGVVVASQQRRAGPSVAVDP